jgi:putative colanic acid biosynthesis acetyltransferase WcaF
MNQVRLNEFDKSNLQRGRGKLTEVAWWLVKVAVVQSKFPWPSIVRKTLLIAFGAKIGKGFYCRPELSVHFPWKLSIGDNVWLGDRTTLHNIFPLVIESNVAFGHEVFVTSGSHDIEDSRFAYRNAPVHIESSVFLGSRCVVQAGVRISEGSAIAAGAVVTRDTKSWTLYGGVPAKPLRGRNLIK